MLTPSLRLGLAATLIGVTVACNPEEIVSTSPEIGARQARAPLAVAPLQQPPQEPLETAYSKTFVRNAGRPDMLTEALDLSRFEGDFVLTVTSGDGSGGNRVRAGSLMVDGVELLSPASFAGATTFTFTREDAPATLEVVLLGAPGSSLRVEIQGHPRRWRVCPGESFYRTYATVQGAVAAAAPGATIWVCNGVHTASALVNKPLTIRPEHSGAATLRDATAPVFLVNGLTTGTFRVVDLRFVLRQRALSATGTWTRIEMDSVTITSVDSANTTAIRAAPANAASQLHLMRSSIAGVAAGVVAMGGTVNVSESTFERTGQAISTFTQGRVDDNTFRSCGMSCVVISGRGDVTVAGNTIVIPGGPRVGSAIQVQVDGVSPVPQAPIRIENNDITGVASATPTLPASWVLERGVGVFTNAGSAAASIVVAGNRISQARAALAVYSINGTVIDAHDNIIDGVFTGLHGDGNPLNPAPINSVINFRRNDVTNAVRSFGPWAGLVTLDATCNWWGSAAGPQNMLWPIGVPLDPGVYTPWATEPIAGRSTVSCP
jgi:hypothetical protein